MSTIDAELVERMADLCRAIWNSGSLYYAEEVRHLYAEACAIKALLPEPVDPDLIIARESVCGRDHDRWPESPWHLNQAERVRAGKEDNSWRVQDTLAGIKHGRELAERAKGGAE